MGGVLVSVSVRMVRFGVADGRNRQMHRPVSLSPSNRLTRTLHDSLLQGHTLPSRGPRHPRPAPLVLQVLVSQQPCHVIEWGEGLWRPWFYSHTPLSRVFFSCLVDFHLDFRPLCFSPPAIAFFNTSLPLFSHCL